jgi:hypothetical protein
MMSPARSLQPDDVLHEPSADVEEHELVELELEELLERVEAFDEVATSGTKAAATAGGDSQAVATWPPPPRCTSATAELLFCCGQSSSSSVGSIAIAAAAV